eukprot:481797_1
MKTPLLKETTRREYLQEQELHTLGSTHGHSLDGGGSRRGSVRRNSSITIAHEALKYRESLAKDSVARRIAKGKISKKQGIDELKKAYTTVAHTLDLEESEIEYSTNLSSGLTEEEA